MEPEPFKIKMIESLNMLSKEERKKKIEETKYNVFKLKSKDIFIDLLTDSGTSAMSDEQWSEMFKATQAYAGGDSYYFLKKVVKEIFGFDLFIPVHQGRAAENIFFTIILDEGDFVPNNMHFDTTKANVKHKGGTPVNLVIKEAYDTSLQLDFKGNMDITKLNDFISEHGKENVPVIMLTITNNTGGGQPVSMKNIREVRMLADKYEILFFFDACRFAENAYFIQQREDGYSHESIRDITKEMFSYVDGFTFSGKKDGLVNIGGLLGVRDKKLYREGINLGIIIEGFPTYGGMACRELSAMAKGIMEATTDEYQHYRHKQVQFVADKLMKAKVPIIEPVGGHAIFVDAKKFLPNVPPEEFPAQSLTTQLYIESGIRAVELGSSAFGETDDKGSMIFAPFEAMRLAIPRRVYTLNQLKYVADSVISLYEKRDEIKGLKRIYAPELLGHFMAEFEPVHFESTDESCMLKEGLTGIRM